MSDLWQSIETAPKDGTVIDLWSARGFRYVGAVWDMIGGGWFWTDSNHHGQIEDAGPFTHWMPQPAPPQSKGE